MEEVKVGRLVHGGQGLGELPDGKKVFVWNALPSETVRVRLIRNKRSYAEAVAEDIIVASPERTTPREENYLSTSPWQMMAFTAENKYKAEIVDELFKREKVDLPSHGPVVHTGPEWHYRNKMEYSFWGDEAGLHLALHQRGSHGKQIVQGSKLAIPAVDAAAGAIVGQLSIRNTRAGDLKTIIVRCNQKGEAVAALYTKLTKFSRLALPQELKGLRVYHSNPKSPASVATELLYELGDCRLADTLLGKEFEYDVDSFFQVNLPVYEKALQSIKQHVTADPTDMYSGVGSIGLSVAKKHAILIETDPATTIMAQRNFTASGLRGSVVQAAAEQALEYITPDNPVIFDPPRAGLHPRVVEACLATLPPQIIYLSCNPATQARDLRLLQASYGVKFFEIYNFFPRTPHIETLAVLTRKN